MYRRNVMHARMATAAAGEPSPPAVGTCDMQHEACGIIDLKAERQPVHRNACWNLGAAAVQSRRSLLPGRELHSSSEYMYITLTDTV